MTNDETHPVRRLPFVYRSIMLIGSQTCLGRRASGLPQPRRMALRAYREASALRSRSCLPGDQKREWYSYARSTNDVVVCLLLGPVKEVHSFFSITSQFWQSDFELRAIAPVGGFVPSGRRTNSAQPKDRPTRIIRRFIQPRGVQFTICGN